MPVNLANVNISLQQFQDISSGQYNAGEVNLTSSTTLGKINNFVNRTGKNNVSLSHAEVLAIKDAFVRALSQSGVSANEINRIRFELGLAPGGATDTALVARSIRPLSRQQIRVILDRNKDAINEHVGPGTIRTHAEVHARYSSLMRAGFAQTRRDVNNATMHMRQTIPDRNIVDAQAILAGDGARLRGRRPRRPRRARRTCRRRPLGASASLRVPGRWRSSCLVRRPRCARECK